MKYKYKYKSEEEKEKIIKKNRNLFIWGYEYLLEGDFIVFSETEIKKTPTLEEQYNKLLNDCEKKISILEVENEALKQEISQIQVSLASLVSAIENK